MYKTLKKIQALLWKGDDMMDQDTLFELQDFVATEILKQAQKEGKVDDLLKDFGFLYKRK